ncbi:hypothetical protein [Lonepinella sp. BR2474]|uniref:hypothetical protein n=1 Tax=Lonepinella sp. BR2474 TaxID=3434548 RepID=UPI003F6E218E
MKISHLIKSSAVLCAALMSSQAMAANTYDVNNFDMFGLKLGMTQEEVDKVLTSKYGQEVADQLSIVKRIKEKNSCDEMGQLMASIPKLGTVNILYSVDRWLDENIDECLKNVRVTSIMYSFSNSAEALGKQYLTPSDKEAFYQSVIEKYGQPTTKWAGNIIWSAGKIKNEQEAQSNQLVYRTTDQTLYLISTDLLDAKMEREKAYNEAMRQKQLEEERKNVVKPQL